MVHSATSAPGPKRGNGAESARNGWETFKSLQNYVLIFLRHNPYLLNFLTISQKEKHSLDTDVQETSSGKEKESTAGTALA